MRIKSLYCACNNRTDNPLDHFERSSVTPCTRLPAPRPWMRALLKQLQGGGGVRKIEGALSPSRLLSCPREKVIEDNYDIEGVDLLGGNSLLWGDIFHKFMEANAAPGEYAEATIPPEGSPAPVVCGVPIRCRIDALSPDFAELIDWKAHSELGSKSKRGDEDTEVQLSLEAHALARMQGRYPDANKAWHAAMTSASTPPWREQDAQLWSEEDILEFKPKNGDFTVRDIIEEYATFVERRAAGVDLDDAVGAMRLVGRGMMNSKKCDVYCFMKGVCDGLVSEFGGEDD